MKNHEILEENADLLAIFMVIVVDISGLTQIVPLFFQDMVNTLAEDMRPYTALGLEDRDTYICKSCVGCHSQVVRPFHAEIERYGHYSVAGESVWDHSSLWGFKRTGSDLACIGGRCSDNWHHAHLYNPHNVVPRPKVSAYPWLVENRLSGKDTAIRMEALRRLDVPYTGEDTAGVCETMRGKIEMDALAAFLRGLGASIKSKR